MERENKEWIFSYTLAEDKKSLLFWELKAIPTWGEKGEYTFEECQRIVELLRTIPVPEFVDEYPWGGKTYKEWDEFVKENKLKIKELLYGQEDNCG